jgi:hypothetical protein
MATKTLTVACGAYNWRAGEENRHALRGETIEIKVDATVREHLERGLLVDPDAEPKPEPEPEPEPKREETPAERPAQDEPMSTLLAWVGDDQERAADVLESEQERPEAERRSTLIGQLEKVLA